RPVLRQPVKVPERPPAAQLDAAGDVTGGVLVQVAHVQQQGGLGRVQVVGGDNLRGGELQAVQRGEVPGDGVDPDADEVVAQLFGSRSVRSEQDDRAVLRLRVVDPGAVARRL